MKAILVEEMVNVNESDKLFVLWYIETMQIYCRASRQEKKSPFQIETKSLSVNNVTVDRARIYDRFGRPIEQNHRRSNSYVEDFAIEGRTKMA